MKKLWMTLAILMFTENAGLASESFAASQAASNRRTITSHLTTICHGMVLYFTPGSNAANSFVELLLAIDSQGLLGVQKPAYKIAQIHSTYSTYVTLEQVEANKKKLRSSFTTANEAAHLFHSTHSYQYTEEELKGFVVGILDLVYANSEKYSKFIESMAELFIRLNTTIHLFSNAEIKNYLSRYDTAITHVIRAEFNGHLHKEMTSMQLDALENQLSTLPAPKVHTRASLASKAIAKIRATKPEERKYGQIKLPIKKRAQKPKHLRDGSASSMSSSGSSGSKSEGIAKPKRPWQI